MFKRLLLVFLLVLNLFGCGTNQNKKESKTFIALDTVITIETYGKNAAVTLDEVSKIIEDTENELSRTNPDSDIYTLNRDHYLSNPSEEIINLIEEAYDYNLITEAAFDITIAPIADLWGFTKDEFNVPDEDVIKETLNSIGMQHIHINQDSISLDEGTEIDFGGIAKGLLAQNIKEIYQTNKLKSANVNLGGDALVFGQKPDGDDWLVGIQNPHAANDTSNCAAILNLSNAYIFTSGSYQRYFDYKGHRYHHIIDPKNGYPADNDLLSVTIITNLDDDNGIMADALSTALFVLGKEKAIELWQNNSELFDILIIDNKDNIFISSPLENHIKYINDGFTLVTIKKD